MSSCRASWSLLADPVAWLGGSREQRTASAWLRQSQDAAVGGPAGNVEGDGSERVALRVAAVDVDPTRTREAVRIARDPRQVAIPGQAQVEAGPNRLAPEKTQRQRVLRFTRDCRIPQEDLVHRAVGEERADDGRGARTHHTRRLLPPCFADCASDARHVDSGAALEAGDLGMLSQQLLRLRIGGLRVLQALDRAAEPRDPRIVTAGPCSSRTHPFHVALRAAVADKRDVDAVTAH